MRGMHAGFWNRILQESEIGEAEEPPQQIPDGRIRRGTRHPRSVGIIEAGEMDGRVRGRGGKRDTFEELFR